MKSRMKNYEGCIADAQRNENIAAQNDDEAVILR